MGREGSLLPFRSPRASGGIGRRAGFRFLCPKGRGGSTPPSPTDSGLFHSHPQPGSNVGLVISALVGLDPVEEPLIDHRPAQRGDRRDQRVGLEGSVPGRSPRQASIHASRTRGRTVVGDVLLERGHVEHRVSDAGVAPIEEHERMSVGTPVPRLKSPCTSVQGCQCIERREAVREARDERVERPKLRVIELRTDVRSCHQGVDEGREGSGAPVGKTRAEQVVDPIDPPSLQSHQGPDHRQEPILWCVPVVLAGDVARAARFSSPAPRRATAERAWGRRRRPAR